MKLQTSLTLVALLVAGCASAPRRARPFPVPRTTGGDAWFGSLAPDGAPDEPGMKKLRVRTADGQVKTLYWEKRSESVGSASDGSLIDGRALPESGPGWVHKGSRPYGTDETVLLLAWAITEVGRNFPGTVAVVIGDLSQEGGGRVPPHKSHRSGRDVDVGYYLRDNEAMRGFVKATPDDIDGEKTWFLLERLIMTGQVKYLFVDYRLQRVLYEAALDSGWSTEDLEPVFEYPERSRKRRPLISHVSGHANHFHLRFRCAPEDQDCVP